MMHRRPPQILIGCASIPTPDIDQRFGKNAEQSREIFAARRFRIALAKHRLKGERSVRAHSTVTDFARLRG
jgi:hypothetical protein